MMWNFEAAFFWCFMLIQLAGLAGLAAARLGEKLQSPTRCQLTFFGCLLLVGVATVICLQSGHGILAGRRRHACGHVGGGHAGLPRHSVRRRISRRGMRLRWYCQLAPAIKIEKILPFLTVRNRRV